MPNERELEADEITTYLKNLFASVGEDIRTHWTEYEKEENGVKGKEYTIYEDEQMQLQTTPAIEIVSKGSTDQIFSIGTQEEKFDYEIYISVANNHPEQAKKYLKAVAKPIFNLLNSYAHRSFTVPGKNFCVYYSEASNIEWNLRRGKGHLAARIVWFCKLLKIGYKN